MLVIGAGELGGPLGDTIQCPHCGRLHAVKYGDRIVRDADGTERKEPSLLAFYRCKGAAYLCGINGQTIATQGE